MSPLIFPTPRPVCKQEVLRYAGCREGDEGTLTLLADCLDSAEAVLDCKACYQTLPLAIEGDVCNFGLFNLTSKGLAAALSGCKKAVVFAATVGVGIDRLILRHSRLSPARAVLLQAIGAERIEALCDAVCAHAAAEEGCYATPRFSPGYGDLPLSAQRMLFAVLKCEKHLGICLNDSLLMSPTKSVTAVFGLTDTPPKTQSKCSRCPKTDCAFRGA